MTALLWAAGTAHAAGSPGDDGFLGTAANFSVLGASTVTNTGPSVLDSSLGLSPGTAVTGFPPGLVSGTMSIADGVALTAQNDATVAAGDLLALPSYDVGSADLDGLSFVAGSYSSASSLLNAGTITLVGDADDIFVFTAVSSLTTGPGSTIVFSGDVQACNVFWRVGSSATLGAGSHLVGTVIAQASVATITGTTVAGRLIAQTGAVTLQNTVFTGPECDRAGGDGSPYGAPEREVPSLSPPTESPSGPTGPVLPIPTDPPAPQALLANSGSDGLVPIVASIAGAVLLALGAAVLTATRRRRYLLRGKDTV
jgi:hypothetical protein